MLSAWWALPFASVLLSIALLPSLVPRFWHLHYGKLTAALSLGFLVPFTVVFGVGEAAHALIHTLVAEYLPFTLLLTALFAVAGGIFFRAEVLGTPRVNAAFLLAGALLASIMGTTGASMLLIRPLLRANRHRRFRTHQVVFFIFLVANIGGSLTPLGDPPLFLGFLQGVGFFWTAQHLIGQTSLLVVALLLIFFVVDSLLYGRETKEVASLQAPPERFGVDGVFNFALLGCIVVLVLMSGLWKSGGAFAIGATEVTWAALARDLGLVAVIVASLLMTPARVRSKNDYSWAPMIEVAKIFAGIFVTILPVIHLLRAGTDGPFAPIIAAVTGPDGKPQPLMYFWATGLLSSFLDNAPTYLVFFNTAGGDVGLLTGTLATTLAAISAGAVFMGAVSYIGNAPNLMVCAIAKEHGVRMPSFFGYMVWSVAVLMPLFVIVGLVWY